LLGLFFFFCFFYFNDTASSSRTKNYHFLQMSRDCSLSLWTQLEFPNPIAQVYVECQILNSKAKSVWVR
jgi:hypothetical protein